MRLFLTLLLSAAVLCLTSSPAAAQAKKSDSVVKVNAKAGKPGDDGKQVVTITLNIEKPWHLYANPVGNKDLGSAATTVKFEGKPQDVKLEYPEGKVVKDNIVGDYKVYEGTVTIKATVRRAKGDTGPLNLSLKFQACNDTSCLLPATVKVNVP